MFTQKEIGIFTLVLNSAITWDQNAEGADPLNFSNDEQLNDAIKLCQKLRDISRVAVTTDELNMIIAELRARIDYGSPADPTQLSAVIKKLKAAR